MRIVEKDPCCPLPHSHRRTRTAAPKGHACSSVRADQRHRYSFNWIVYTVPSATRLASALLTNGDRAASIYNIAPFNR